MVIKKNKLAVINPPSPFLTNERVFPNIGLVRVATTLKNEGHDVDVFDFNGVSLEEMETKMIKISNDYDYYGFSSTTPQFKYTMKALNALKEGNSEAKTIIGGPHASALYHTRERNIRDDNISDLEKFDTIFAGEGEDTENIFKPGWQKGELIKNIDEVAIPDRSLIDIESYEYNGLPGKTTTIQTQRGCPNKCDFCCGREIEMYKKVRQHSPKRVLKELDALNRKFGYNSFMWYDDEVNINPGRLEELCDRLSKRNYQHRGFVTADQVVKHPETIDYLKKAGFVKLCTGVESGSDRILKIINKKADSKMNYEARKIIGERGIHYEAFMMMGHPSETKYDVNQTVKWLEKAKPDDFDIGILTPYPGSKIYDNAEHSDKYPEYTYHYKGLYFNKPDFSKENTFYKGKDAQSASFTRTDNMSERYIHKRRDIIEKMKVKK